MLTTLHIAILVCAVGTILVADHHAFSYLTGRTPLLDRRRTMQLHYAVLVLLAGMLVTGFVLVYRGWAYYFAIPEFRFKLFFVALLVINSFVIQRIMHVAFETPFAELPAAHKRAMFVSGAVSTISWVGAISLGLYLFW